MSAARELPFGRPILGAAEKAAVAEVLDGFQLTHGPRCARSLSDRHVWSLRPMGKGSADTSAALVD